MPIYIYKALTSNGQELNREATASSEEELRRELESRGLLVKGVREKRIDFLAFRGQSVKPVDFLQVNQEMVTLLKAGLTLPEVLDLTSDVPESPVLTSILKRVLEEVRTGSPFSAACAKYPKIFDGLYISSLKTGERTGDLAKPLLRYQDYLRRKVALQGKVSQAMVYPLFLLGVLILVLGLLFTFVMPRFAALYTDFGAVMPLPTRILMLVVKHLPLLGGLLAGLGFLAWAFVKAWAATPLGRLRLDEAKQNLPLVGQFVLPFTVSQLARTLATLLSGGTPLTEALKVAREAVTNRAFAARFDRVIGRVTEGEGLSKAMGAENLMPRQAVKLIEVGEASGQLEAMFQEIADSFEGLLERRVQQAMTLVEPIFILLTGLLIGSVIVVMYLPIIHLSDIVK
ncbi:MAG TPA: type II secretion system F family protein [bacterium]|jgi:type IV pilus assembly protein PilC|nr:type II secretion system F family protein [bacterium]